jgi:hypothetical protein
MEAIDKGHINICELLVKSGADVNLKDEVLYDYY